MPVYQSDDEWPIVVIMNLVKIREAIYQVGVATMKGNAPEHGDVGRTGEQV
jgi:hypothetical protein